MPGDPDYKTDLSPTQIAAGGHRRRVGGRWDEIGKLQLDYLRSQGLEPQHKLLDVACGALRAGVHFVDYLDPGNYYGIDINQSLLDAGYDLELTEPLQRKLPRENLRRVDRFECDFGVKFDVAMAQSLFTHVPLNQVRLCMWRVAQQMRPGGRFFLTFNVARPGFPLDGVMKPNSKSPKYGERNIYWYYRSDMRWAASFAPWDFKFVGEWGHPRGQRMIILTRRPDGAAPVAARPPAAGTARRGRQVARRAARRLMGGHS